MNAEKIKKTFPLYFRNFEIPKEAKEQEIEVYRACPTRKVEKASFLNTYEENGFQNTPGRESSDPQDYCLSVCTRLKDIKRFVSFSSKYQPPLVLAKGHTTRHDGVSCRTKEWKRTRSSHVDWWLYEDAQPWLAFEVTCYEYENQNFPDRR